MYSSLDIKFAVTLLLYPINKYFRPYFDNFPSAGTSLRGVVCGARGQER